MAIVLGLNCKLFIEAGGSGGYTSGTEATNCKDVTLKVEKNKADVTVRGNNGWRAWVAVLKDATVSFKMLWDTADATFTLIQAAFLASAAPQNTLEVAVLDGYGGHGLEATMMVTTFTRNEPLEEAVTVDVELAITYDIVHPPQWV
jgi:Phage tail tube protein